MTQHNLKLNRKDGLIIFIILATVAWRSLVSGHAFFPELANFSPLAAMALFGGAYLSRGKALIFPLSTIWISDILLNRFVFVGEWTLFYDGFFWVYGAFALIVICGRYLKTNKSLARFFASVFGAVFIHWFVTDLGVWLGSTMYPQTLAGFWACLVAAIPFELNLLYGTLIYGSVLFGSIEYLKHRNIDRETANQLA